MIFESLSAFSSKLYFFTSFVNSAQGFPKPLSKEDEQKYLQLNAKGDKEARDILINHNLRLVAHIVKKYTNSLEADDLISVGAIGLIKAVDSFDASKGALLSTYAARCIENEILMLIRSNKRHKDVISLNSGCRCKNDEEELELEDIISVDGDEIVDAVETNFMMDKVLALMKEHLTDIEQKVLIMRFGLLGHDQLPQREVAKKFGFSRSYISRIENKAIATLQKYIATQESEKK